ncbi:GNAT family N-acetyltransferase [Sphingomonas sp. So64.6b]|uniref:GNAT family N-acetyltransferase n=1 Tax=Sphingomonas sp. So64.6b TaxID=2997354 RepID=UPI0016033FCD|nr:GNAT family N-acetyltransferase [Sphingomonas sp. So64.6b]QNA83613.1 GNAT family N-acetyltransferase [Sphingomonas sp. So64.6b]
MIETERLILRWPLPADHAALHAMWADPAVMIDLGPLKSPVDSDAALARHAGYRDSHGLGFWTVELREDGSVIGFCGLKPGAENTPAEGEVEIGWMLARPWWGKGYAGEAAMASLDWAWARLAVPRVVAITAARNLSSQRLMQRLGMTRRVENFEHPAFPESDPLRDSVIFTIDRPVAP